MSEKITRDPLPLDAIAAHLHKYIDVSTPLPMRQMAAKAALPMQASDLVYVLYQLQFDTDEEVRAAAHDSLKSLPADVVKPVLQEDLPAVLLHELAVLYSDKMELIEILINNAACHDITIRDIAAKANAEIAERIANQHVRLLRYPEIIEKLYMNPNTRMVQVDKILELAKLNNVKLPNLSAVQEAAQDTAYKADARVSDEEFEAILHDAAHAKEIEDKQDELDALVDNERDARDEEESRRLSKWQMISKMSPPQKVRLATLGGREERTLLLRDSQKIVYMAAIQSPRLSLSEVNGIASSKAVSNEIIAYIAGRKEWTRYYPVVLALVNNPKCPVADALGFLKTIRPNDLKAIQRSKSVSSQVARQAQLLYRQKSAGR
ncbi:MAG: hypothetical protein WC966_04155 [Bradymonadales bacterium]|jgi:hypothetical protein